jgi:iron(III) transport system permease protein
MRRSLLRSEVPGSGRGILSLRSLVMACLAVTFVLPMAAVIMLALNPDDLKYLVGKDVLQAAVNSAVTAGVSGLLATVIGAGLAIMLDRTNVFGRRYMRLLFLSPFLVPPFIGAIAWTSLLGPSGSITLFVTHLFGASEPAFSLFGGGGITALLTVHSYPAAYIIISAALRRVPRSLEEASRISGASQMRTLRAVTLPLLRPALIATFTLTAVSNLSDFGIPAILGLPVQYYTLSTLIYRYLVSAIIANPLQVVSTIGIVLLIIAVGAVLLQRKLSNAVQFESEDAAPDVISTGRARVPLTLVGWVIGIVFALFPLAALLEQSLIPAPGVPLTWKTLTFMNFVNAVKYPGAINGITNSIVLSIGAGLICGILGLAIGSLITRTKSRANVALDIASTLPQSIPGLVIGVGWIIAGIWIGLYNTSWIILLAYVTAFVAFVVQSVRAPLAASASSLEDAARISGAGALRTLIDISWRSALPAAGAGAILVALTAVRELTISVLLAAPGTRTLGVVIFDLQESGDYSASASLSLLVVIVGLLGLGILASTSKKTDSNRT